MARAAAPVGWPHAAPLMVQPAWHTAGETTAELTLSAVASGMLWDDGPIAWVPIICPWQRLLGCQDSLQGFFFSWYIDFDFCLSA